MSVKPKIAFYWCAGCGGCDEAVLDLAEDLLPILEGIEIVFWPVAMDFKRRDVEALPDGAITATFINGSIRTSEQEEMAHLLRRKSQYLVAFGACAQLGGIPGLANLYDRDAILRTVYEDAPTLEKAPRVRPQTASTVNGSTLPLPDFHATVRTLPQVVAVDFYVPGCPPTPNLIRQALEGLLRGALPAHGAVLAPDVALCDECPRKDSKPTQLAFDAFHRIHEIVADPQTCLLAQGIVCLGPATRSGCGAACLSANMPCTGCFGPTSRVRDQGAKMASALSANLAGKDETAIAATLDGLPDPVGTLYRYSLPSSLARRRWSDTASPRPRPAEPRSS